MTGDWEIRSRPYRDPRTGVTSTDEVTVTAINRDRGIVLAVARMTPERLATFDPDAEWRRG